MTGLSYYSTLLYYTGSDIDVLNIYTVRSARILLLIKPNSDFVVIACRELAVLV